MLRLFNTEFTYKGHTYMAMASVMNYAQRCSVTIYVPDVSLHNILPGGKLAFDAQTGIQLDRDGLFAAQDLLAIMIMATEKWDGFPAVKIGCKTSSFPQIRPFFIQSDVALQFHINRKLKDTIQLNLLDITNSQEVSKYIRMAIAELLEKWEEELRGRNLSLEFFIACTVSAPGIRKQHIGES